MIPDANSSLHKESSTLKLLMVLQVASSALQITHQVFPKARLLAAAHAVDAITLLLAPSASKLADVHMDVSKGLAAMQSSQAFRSAEITNISGSDVLDFQPVE